MKKTEFKSLIKECITEVICEKEDYYDGLRREYRKAQKERNAEKYLYYGQAFNYSAVAGWDQFKGSWAYDNWRKKFAKEIEAINQNWKRHPYHETKSDIPLEQDNYSDDLWIEWEKTEKQKQGFHDDFRKKAKNAEKEGDAEKYLYYNQSFNNPDLIDWDQFKGSQSYEKWKRQFSKEIDSIKREFERVARYNSDQRKPTDEFSKDQLIQWAKNRLTWDTDPESIFALKRIIHVMNRIKKEKGN